MSCGEAGGFRQLTLYDGACQFSEKVRLQRGWWAQDFPLVAIAGRVANLRILPYQPCME